MLKISRTLQSCNRATLLSTKVGQFVTPNAISRPSHLRIQVRCLSAGDIFGKIDSSKIADLPNVPLPLPPKVSVEELVASGQSVLKDLDLFSWATPPSYVRWALETVHMEFDTPWWLTIAMSSIALRLLTLYVPIMSQRMVALQSRYKKELKQFNNRINDARMEGDNMMVHQILLEQQKFLSSKGINMFKQFGVMAANGFIFITNFIAIKKMASASYPGFENGGILWFPNLLETDPYMGLPAISAVTTFVVFRLGIDSGVSSDQMAPAMKLGMQYAIPAIVFISGWWFPSAICIHWVTSNTISLVLAGMFRLQPVRKALRIPPIVKHDSDLDSSNAITAAKELWKNNRAKKAAPPSISTLRKTDYEKFKQAGKGKPISD